MKNTTFRTAEQKNGEGQDTIAKLLELEKESAVFDYTVKDIPVWLFIRSLLPDYINRGTFHTPRQMITLKEKLRIAFPYLRTRMSGFMKIWKLFTAKRWFLTGVTTRSYFPGYGYVDVYFDLLLDHSAQKNDIILELPTFTGSLHKKDNYKPERVVFGDFLYFLELFVRYNPNTNDRYTLKKVAEIGVYIFEKLTGKREEGLYRLFYNEMFQQIRRYNVFRLLFFLCRPAKIVLLSSYSSTCILLTHHARLRGVETIEFQHAHIYPQHIGYRYDSVAQESLVKLPRPHKFIVFGPYYKELLMRQSWLEDSIMVVGNPNIETYRILNKFQDSGVLTDITKCFKYVIIVVSQHTTIETFIDFLRDAGKHDDCLFIIKIHPRGSGEKEAYEKSLNVSKNIIFSPPGLSLWNLFQHANAAIGAYSTGLLDALSFGIPAFCLQSSFSAYFADLIDSGYMVYVQTIDEMKTQLEQSRTMKVMSLYNPLSFDMIDSI